jgi:heat shock protein HslJ
MPMISVAKSQRIEEARPATQARLRRLVWFAAAVVLCACGERQAAPVATPSQETTGAAPTDVAPDANEAAAGSTEASGDNFHAAGNEPGWSLEIDDAQMKLVTDYGESTVVVDTPAAESIDGGTRFVAQTDKGALSAVILNTRCADDMSGMPYPNAVTVEYDGRTLKGCGGEPAQLLEGDAWTVDEIAGTRVPADLSVTLRFDATGRAGGQGPCNGYGAGYTLTGEGLTFSKGMSTMRACEQAVMDLEGAYLATLEQVHRFEIADDGSLVLHTPDEKTIKAHRK